MEGKISIKIKTKKIRKKKGRKKEFEIMKKTKAK